MILSVIIVNYNVKHFLEQCLNSVFASERKLANGEQLDIECIVVDNNSVDGSVEMVRERFPEVVCVDNKDNPGFAKANNQALRIAKGDYLLLLNPDTIVEKETFIMCINFMMEHRECGALGVKMINGEGVYLKESKRGFPTPETSFYKISGLIKLFPHHPKIARYYMGHLSNDEVNEIEILPGAFIMMSRESYEKVGGLDESYFMYGEDIDFSWRFILAGYKNYYLPTTRIIHYKGESTKKGSMNYVYTFYNAMVIFAKKYFSGSNAKLYIGLINMAIWARAGLSFVKRIFCNIAQPLVDFLIAFGGFVAAKQLWATFWAENVSYYPSVYTWVVIPFYILFMMLVSWLYGGYDKPLRIGRLVRGMGLGCLLLLAFYSLLDETQRYSRMVLLLGSAWSILSAVAIRIPKLRKHTDNTLLVGSPEETQRVEQLIRNYGIDTELIEHVDPAKGIQLSELIRVFKITDVVFCGRDIQTQDIISQMASLQATGVRFKIVPSDSDIIIGSNAISSREDIFSVDINTIDTPYNRRNKRLFDIFSSLILLILSPLHILFQKQKRDVYPHLFQVLVGKKSWVSPENGVFTPADILDRKPSDTTHLDQRYKRNYKLGTDIAILFKNINKL
ncbi:MAG: glycosyltransferase family 2 protein [Bacteroidales bacterium]|nr:glycosyltransferase family 2 protein [Bacteroidales bacterium]